MYQNFFIGAAVAFTFLKVLDWAMFKFLVRHHVRVKSRVDGEYYYVLNQPKKQQAANMLARVKKSVIKVIEQVKRDERIEIDKSMKDAMKRLTSRFRSDYTDLLLIELPSSNPKHLAMNRNKGDIIFICLRQLRHQPGVGSLDNVLYIALHEIAHIMTKKFEEMVNGVSLHGPEFRSYESYVFKVASRLGIMNASSVRGRSHCGGIIP